MRCSIMQHERAQEVGSDVIIPVLLNPVIVHLAVYFLIYAPTVWEQFLNILYSMFFSTYSLQYYTIVG